MMEHKESEISRNRNLLFEKTQPNKKGLYLENSNTLDAQELLDDPKHFLEKYGLDFETALCPDEVHEAFKKGELLAHKLYHIVQLNSLNQDTFHLFKEVVKEHFGNDYKTEIIPYGLKFLEHMYLPPDDSGTITGSATVTFADRDGDVDG